MNIVTPGALALAIALLVAGAFSCHRDSAPGAGGGGDPSAARTAGPLAGVVDPWTWPRAAGATDRERALEDIGPYEPQDRARPDSPPVNTNADYWTRLVGLAWDRDVDIDFDRAPVDLDGDRAPDTRVTRHLHARGGILANPRLFGLVPTPDDPRGRVGRISVSTGVLGLREALTAEGKPSGQIGMTCFACHGGVDPATGRIVLGLPGTAFDYGLLLATAAVLDDRGDGASVAAQYRRTHGFPDGRTVRARLLLAGPGRQDLTGEFGLDVTIPGTHSAHYPGTKRVRQGTSGIVNPISVPGILAAAGVDLQNWSGSEVASVRWLRRVVELARQPAAAALAALGLPAGDPADARGSAAARRALLLDLRNLGTLGLQQDAFPGLLWADAVYGYTTLDARDVVAVPAMFSAAALRRVIAGETVTLGAQDQEAVARGRELFANRVIGVIANRQILKEVPPRYAATKLTPPLLAPIDEALGPTIQVRCASCHSATPGGPPLAIAETPPPFGRCSTCHRAHQPFEGAPDDRPATARKPLALLNVPGPAPEELAFCGRCHERHRPFAPVVYSSSLLLPFDADGDGRAQDDEGDDARAGGIGTEALLAFDVPRPERPRGGFSVDVPVLERLYAIGPIRTTRTGVSWVRVPPLTAVRATAPYLHNGSVPTLRALLDPPARRPVRFPLGAAGFVFDTRLPGNRNIGHDYGTNLTPAEKNDLVAFLESL